VASRLAVVLWCLVPAASAQSPSEAQSAYDALRSKNYDSAISFFRLAIEAASANPALRKDLAYTYLKTGENEAARDQFAEALRLDPADEHVALEYAFLCYETKKQAEARRVFDRLRKSGAPATQATAEQAFQNIDQPLAQEIVRWSAVAAQSPKDFSAQQELAQLSEQRDDLAAAAEHYLAAWHIRPAERDLLIDVGRVWQALGRTDQATAVLIAASRGSSPRVTEQARELLPPRAPSPAEFRAALEIDPSNLTLRREFAHLLIELKQPEEAERQFRILAEQAPQDLAVAAQLGFLRLQHQDREGAMLWFDRVLKSDDDELIERVRDALRLPAQRRRRNAPPPPKEDAPPAQEIGPEEMGERSYKAGYLKDALKYFEAAHEADPLDFPTMLHLGWTNNAMHQDRTALAWFAMARRSPDPAISAEAKHAYENLRPAFARWRVTTWIFPFYSTRWRDVFAYAQTKAELRLGHLPFRPYVSVRFIGDTRRTAESAGAVVSPQYLSEDSFIVALGVASNYWHGAMAWAEAGSALCYTGCQTRGRAVSDYRGGVSFSRAKGHTIGAESPGFFAETHDDGVFVSRFANDTIIYSQNQAGYTPPRLAGLRTQLYWNVNLTSDAKGQYWANFFETGPGLHFRWAALPPALVFSVNWLAGKYLINAGNPGKPTFNDFRAGFWYAFTH
jgi:Tfp pilus assembly protein PilF